MRLTELGHRELTPKVGNPNRKQSPRGIIACDTTDSQIARGKLAIMVCGSKQSRQFPAAYWEPAGPEPVKRPTRYAGPLRDFGDLGYAERRLSNLRFVGPIYPRNIPKPFVPERIPEKLRALRFFEALPPGLIPRKHPRPSVFVVDEVTINLSNFDGMERRLLGNYLAQRARVNAQADCPELAADLDLAAAELWARAEASGKLTPGGKPHEQVKAKG